jgi:hypothetical protein
MRWLILVAAVTIVFGVTVAIAWQVLPGPHSSTDYLVIGSIATFVALIALFAVLITTWIRTPDVFVKKRPKDLVRVEPGPPPTTTGPVDES